MKKWYAYLTAVLLILALIGCGGGQGSKEAQVKLGGIFPLTGGAATYGQSSKNGMQMAIDEFNAEGHTIGGKNVVITPLYGDTEGQPEKAANVGRKLINQDHVNGIIGAVMSKNSLAIAPIAQAAKVVMISPTSTNPKVTEQGDYIFRACFIDPFQGTVMAKYAYNDLGARRAAILYDNGNDYNKGLAEYFIKSFKALGGQIVAEEAFTDEDKTVDFKAQLTKIKTANPDFLYIPNYYQSAALIMKQAQEIGLDVNFGGGDGWDSPELVNIGGSAVEGGFFSNHFSKDDSRSIVQTFVKNYKAKYGADPDALATLAYDATKIYLTALVKADSLDSAKIREAMTKTDAEFVAGEVTFDSNRNPIKSAVILTINGGQQKFVETVSP